MNLVGTRNGIQYEIKVPRTIQFDDYVRNELKVPKKLLHHWRMSKQIFVNGETPRYTGELKEGDVLSLPLFLKEDVTDERLSKQPVDVLYEDDHVLVVNKPALLNVHAVSERKEHTLDENVQSYLLHKGEQTIARHVHRLDRDTSGTILYAKHHYACTLLDSLLSERAISRTYAAVAEGKLPSEKGTINKNIGKVKGSERREVQKNGQHAVTHYRVIRYSQRHRLSLLELQLETGRTHQIRVHLTSLGAPIAGDTLYGGSKHFMKYQALHAKKLSFFHPFLNKVITVEAPLPKSWESVPV